MTAAQDPWDLRDNAALMDPEVLMVSMDILENMDHLVIRVVEDWTDRTGDMDQWELKGVLDHRDLQDPPFTLKFWQLCLVGIRIKATHTRLTPKQRNQRKMRLLS